MGAGRGNGSFNGTYGSSVKISDKTMYQDGKHFNKHGREMGYTSKKEYDAAAKDFARKYQEHPDAKVYDGEWNGSGVAIDVNQRVITYDGKTVVIGRRYGQIIDFYQGDEYRGIVNMIKIR